MKKIRDELIRFTQYSGIGITTFGVDVLLLYVFVEYAEMYYLFATALAFVIAVTLNYYASRHFVFAGTKTSFWAGYVSFIGISLTGMLAMLGLMYVAVSLLGIHYLISRILVAALVGIWNYTMNVFLTFKM